MSPFTRGRCALALVVSVGSVVGMTVLGVTVAAQAARRSQTPLQQATRALLEGRFDEVEGLANQLGQNDPAAAALKARALIARGRYADAEALLRTAATRQPVSVAALELGLLGKMLGHADANAILNRVAAQSQDLLVAARALRALGEFMEANDTFRSAASRAPKDPDVNTRWGELYLDTHQNADALELFKIALEADPSVDTGASRRRHVAGRRRPATGRRRRQEGAGSQSVVRGGTRLPGPSGARPGPQRRSARRAAKGARHQSEQS